jgi:hypothetical protein
MELEEAAERRAVDGLADQRDQRGLIAVIHCQEAGRLELSGGGRAMILGHLRGCANGSSSAQRPLTFGCHNNLSYALFATFLLSTILIDARLYRRP